MTTLGPRADSVGKERGEEVRMVRKHNLINLCQTPPQVDRAAEQKQADATGVKRWSAKCFFLRFSAKTWATRDESRGPTGDKEVWFVGPSTSSLTHTKSRIENFGI